MYLGLLWSQMMYLHSRCCPYLLFTGQRVVNICFFTYIFTFILLKPLITDDMQPNFISYCLNKVFLQHRGVNFCFFYVYFSKAVIIFSLGCSQVNFSKASVFQLCKFTFISHTYWILPLGSPKSKVFWRYFFNSTKQSGVKLIQLSI